MKAGRRALFLAIAAFAVLAVFAWFRFAGRDVPAGQPALTALDTPAAIAALQAEFNAAADRTRVILLLSPT